MKSLIQALIEVPGPSGYEAHIRQAIRAEVEPLADEVRVDALGNLIARKGEPGPDGITILLAAHMDEIGLIATHIDENGFVRFLPVGGVGARTCPGSRVRFLSGAQGVIGVEVLEDASRVPGFNQMFIDLGVRRKEDCPIKVGEMAVFERPFLDLGDRWVAKAMDDRISVAVLVEALRQVSDGSHPLPNRVYFVFSSQEEVGPGGATTAAFSLEPDLALAVDVTASGDTPRGIRMAVGLGKGPAIKVRDRLSISDPRVVEWMVQTAEHAGIPYQLEVLEAGGTDASAMQFSRSGVPAGCLSIPCRYVHSPSEMVDAQDVEQALRLLVELISQPVHLGEL